MLKERDIYEFVSELIDTIDQLQGYIDRRSRKNSSYPRKKKKILLKYLELMVLGKYDEQFQMVRNKIRVDKKKDKNFRRFLAVHKKRRIDRHRSIKQTAYNKMKKGR